MEPKNQEKLIFNNTCGCLFEAAVLERAMLWWSSGRVLMKNRKIYMHGNYPAVSIFDEKLHIHRLIYCYKNRKKLLRSIHVHHKDDNKLNTLTDNLEEIKDSIHMSHHNKGKVLSKDHKDKISLANRRRKGIKMKSKYPMPDLADYVNQGLSISAISKIYGCSWDTVKNRIHETPELLK